MMLSKKDLLPWYRQPWPWFLMGLPAAAVIAGSITLWLAMSTSDGLVVDDYYKQGLAIQQTMARSQQAADLGLQAQVHIQPESFAVEVSARSGEAVPPRIRVIFSHPTRVGQDQIILMTGVQGRFTGIHRGLSSGRWDIQIEDEPRTWRLNGAANLPTETDVRIVPATSQPVD